MKTLVKLIVLCLAITKVFSFMYTLPNDSNWPSRQEFLNLRNSITGKVILKGDNDYNPHTWNRITNVPKPAVVIQPKNKDDILAGLKFARKYNIRISVQSTGYHQDHRNIYDNSVHFDLSTLTFKSVDIDKKTLILGPGNSFGQIHQFVASQTNRKLISATGLDPGVGIYGWTVGGGHGPFTRQFGLGVDQLLSIDLILANYSIVIASETQNAELFRAIRGSGGGTYGIAINLTVALHDNPGVVSTFNGLYGLFNETIMTFSKWLINASDRVVANYTLIHVGSVEVIFISSTCFGDTAYCTPFLSPLSTGCLAIPQINITCQPVYERFASFYDYIAGMESNVGGVSYFSSTALNKDNIESGLKDIVAFLDTNDNTVCIGSAVLGGASANMDLNREKTSVALEFRQSLMAISCSSMMDETSLKSFRDYQVKIMDDLAEKILKKYSKWVSWNEPQHNFPADDWKERYWGGMDNYNRLLKVKKELDPDDVFTCYHCVGYERLYNEDPSVCPLDKCTCSNTPNGNCTTYFTYNRSSKSKETNSISIILAFSILIGSLAF